MPRDETASKLEIVTEIPDKAMVIFAHPDDAEIGSGGVAAKWAAAGCEVTYVLCTNGAAAAGWAMAVARSRAEMPTRTRAERWLMESSWRPNASTFAWAATMMRPP